MNEDKKPGPPEVTVWATSTDLAGSQFERKVYFLLIRDGGREFNVALTVKPAIPAVDANVYQTPDYDYTLHDWCDHEHDECILDKPGWEEWAYGPQPGKIYQEVREGYKQEEGQA